VNFQGMKCPHCGNEMDDAAKEQAVGNRQELISWLTTWRKENGLGNPSGVTRIRPYAVT
jgi:hypothetical protein